MGRAPPPARKGRERRSPTRAALRLLRPERCAGLCWGDRMRRSQLSDRASPGSPLLGNAGLRLAQDKPGAKVIQRLKKKQPRVPLGLPLARQGPEMSHLALRSFNAPIEKRQWFPASPPCGYIGHRVQCPELLEPEMPGREVESPTK